MTNNDFTITFIIDQTANDVFNAIKNVRGWWSEELEGSSEKLNDEFIYRHGNLHYSRHKLIEVEPDKKMVWLTTDSRLSFVKKQDEWNNTKMIFEISSQGDKTKLVISHAGLIPAFECFNDCSRAWTYYLQKSLVPLITTGRGNPDKKVN